MKKLSLGLYLKLSFNILLQAAIRKKQMSFGVWVLEKSVYNKRINRLGSKFLQSHQKNPSALLTLATFLRLQYQIRTKVFLQATEKHSKKRMVLKAVLVAYSVAIKKLIKACCSLCREYHVDADLNDRRIIFAVGFPSHSFNFVRSELNIAGGSFAEYLKLHYQSDVTLVCINEYTRHSKLLESNSNEMRPSAIQTMSRYKAYTCISILALMKGLYQALKIFLKEYLSLSPLQLIEFSSRVALIPYKRLFELHQHSINKIYLPPFSELEYLNFEMETFGKVAAFYYSENILIPPVKGFGGRVLEHDQSYHDVNFGMMGCYGTVEGYTEVVCKLNQMAREVFDSQGNLSETEFQYFPCLLGFERNYERALKPVLITIALFDVPPESEESQLNRTIIGDMTADITFVESFLSDFLKLDISVSYQLLYKPKYSLENYSFEYRKIIDSLINKFHDKFVFLDPYVRLTDIMRATDLVLSFPYTSTHKFAKYSGVQSYYFIPDRCVNDFKSVETRDDCIYGINDVNRFIRKLAEDMK